MSNDMEFKERFQVLNQTENTLMVKALYNEKSYLGVLCLVEK